MKTIAFASILALSACALGNEPLDDDDIENDDIDDLSDAMVIHQEDLAIIDVGDGEVIFRIDLDGPEAGTISTLERIRPRKDGTVRIPHPEELSPLELFATLTDSAVPVPGALVDAEESADVLALVADRDIVERHDEVIRGSLSADSRR